MIGAKFKVLNRRDPRTWAYLSNGTAVYVGRPGPWGNPFKSPTDGDRMMVIAKFRTYVMARPKLLKRIRQHLRGKHLMCWCAPLPCHADVLLEIANADPTQ